MIGNDVVDLKDIDSTDILSNTRFIQRVFTPEEQSAINNSRNSLQTLWTFWAMKESAFKALSAHIPDLMFQWKRFQCDIDFHIVTYDSYALPVKSMITDEYIHIQCGGKILNDNNDAYEKLIAYGQELIRYAYTVSLYGYLLQRPVEKHADSAFFFKSASSTSNNANSDSQLVRELLLESASQLFGVSPRDMEIQIRDGKRRIPRLYVKGKGIYPVSMSHHGRFLAAAIADCPDHS